jgi:hypothetical protein
MDSIKITSLRDFNEARQFEMDSLPIQRLTDSESKRIQQPPNNIQLSLVETKILFLVFWLFSVTVSKL